MKIVFLYNHPHPVHGIWAESIQAIFIQDRVNKLKIFGISRIIKSLITLKKIPKDTDAVLCESASQMLAGSLWKLFNKKKKLACIVSDPKMHYLKSSGFLSKKLTLWMFRKADLLIPTSPLMLSLIPGEINCVKKVVFPYADISRYKKHNCSLNKKTIIFTGRIGYEKGADRTSRAFEMIKLIFPESKLYLVGFGDMQEEISNKKIPGLEITGWQDSPEKYMEKGSIYLSLARIEPAGIAILEAMLLGLVPIVSYGVGNRYIVEKISKELVVENEQEAAIIIEKLWKNSVLLKKYSKRAKIIASKYSAEK